MTEEQKDEINLLKELIADTSISSDEKQVYIDGLAELEKNIEEKPKATEKPQATQRAKQTTKPKKAITKKANAVKKPTPLPSDVDAMKKAIKERTGKTEAECEDIIAQYRKLRDKAKVNRAKRTEKLKSNDDLITGTNVITPVAQIEKDAEIVKVKIEKQVEQIENKAEREVVKKDKTKDEVKVEVEQKVVKQLAKLSDEMVSSATTFVKNIQTELKKVDKTEAKKFLLGLRNEIDVLLSKFAGGGTLQTYNITENMSASSVNPSKFNRGGRLDKRMMSNTRMANDGRVATFKIGDRWKPNFDYEGMLKVGSSATISMGIDTLRELSYSFEDVNYHTINADLIRAIDFLKMGEDNQAQKSLDKFNKNCSEELNSINFKRGGKVNHKFNNDNEYIVNVGNIGNIRCDSLLEARMMYNEYVEQSKSGMGRAGNEYVGLYENGEPIMEYFGTLDNDEEYENGGSVDSGDFVRQELNFYKKGGGVEEKPQYILDLEVQGFNHDEYLAFCYEYGIDEDDAMEMSNFIYNLTDNQANEIINKIDNNYFFRKGGVTGKDKRAKKVIRNVNGFEREYPIGDAWRKEHKLENKSEKYEVPYSSRKS